MPKQNVVKEFVAPINKYSSRTKEADLIRCILMIQGQFTIIADLKIIFLSLKIFLQYLSIIEHFVKTCLSI